MHPDTAKTHWPVSQKRRGVVILEEGGNGNECAWCPVMEMIDSDPEENKEAARTHWLTGQHFFGEGNIEKAMECYARGTTADPSNWLCWLGISRVSAIFVTKTLCT